jgi:isochorismate pyruvate lyase
LLRSNADPAAAAVETAMTAFEEPCADGAPVRRFRDPRYVPQASSLGELRARIDSLDAQIVELLAARASFVRDATRFKRDPHQVAAPARQAEVFTRVRALAAARAEEFPPLPDIVEAAYRVLVAGFVAGEERFFAETEPISP